jgi:putative endonuclease
MVSGVKWNDKDSTSRPSAQPGKRSSGLQAEELAARFLTRHGLRVIERNYRCRGGEIDLVCRDGRTLVFVEVRYRQHHSHGGAADSITTRKQGRIVLAARHYLASHSCTDADCRFDCLLFDALSETTITWLRHAFDAA